jgi:Na+-driven multidrug efflux pump
MAVAPIMALSVILGGGLQGAGDTRGTMWVIIRAMWLVRLPLAAALTFWFAMGAQGVWIAMVLSMVVQATLMVRRFQSGVWKHIGYDDKKGKT